MTVLCVANLTFVTNVADFCRYTPTRRDMRLGLMLSALTVVALTTFLGGYVAVAAGETNPYVVVAAITSNKVVLVLLLLAVVVQTVAANITNVYTGGLSLVNAIPCARARPRKKSSSRARGHALGLPRPDRACAGLDHPSRQRRRADHRRRPRRLPAAPAPELHVDALYAPTGRYRYVEGVNVAAVAAVVIGVAVYYAVPHEWLKVLWGVGVSAAAYLALVAVQDRLLAARLRTA